MNFSMNSSVNNSVCLWVNESLTNLSAISSNENGSSFPIGSGGNKKRVNYVFTAYLVIGVVGVIGNAVVVATILSNKAMKKKFTNILIVNQSYIDLVSSVLVIMIPLFTYIQLASQNTKLGYIYRSWFYCAILRSKVPLFSIYQSSTCNIMAIAIERYLEIGYPLLYKTRMTKKKLYFVMVMVWVSGFVYQIITGVPFMTAQMSGPTCLAVKVYPSSALRVIVSYVNLVVHFVGPIFVMVFCYIKIFTTLRKRSKDSFGTSNRHKVLSSARKNVIKITASVCICFFLCWIWSQVYYFLYLQNVPGIDLDSPVANFAVIMTAVNVCINPYIYALSYKEFQMALKKLFCRTSHVDPISSISNDSQSRSKLQSTLTNSSQNKTDKCNTSLKHTTT